MLEKGWRDLVGSCSERERYNKTLLGKIREILLFAVARVLELKISSCPLSCPILCKYSKASLIHPSSPLYHTCSMSSHPEQEARRVTSSALERPYSAPPVNNELLEEDDDLEFFSPAKLEELEDEQDGMQHPIFPSGRRKSKSDTPTFKPSNPASLEMWSMHSHVSSRSASRFTFTTQQVETGDSLLPSLLPSLQGSFQPSAVEHLDPLHSS